MDFRDGAALKLGLSWRSNVKEAQIISNQISNHHHQRVKMLTKMSVQKLHSQGADLEKCT
jgi:hypothetical protein